MSIPLIQKPEKDDINTSIIAIKRNIERINMLLGLVDNESPDLSGFATKQELQDAVTELQPVDEVTIGNMHSVSSNAVAIELDKVKIKWVGVSGGVDGSGNLKITNLPAGYIIPIIFASSPDGADVNYNLFFSALTQSWYIHASSFDTGYKVTNVIVLGRLYYAEYLN